jgi:hypothetical protein
MGRSQVTEAETAELQARLRAITDGRPKPILPLFCFCGRVLDQVSWYFPSWGLERVFGGSLDGRPVQDGLRFVYQCADCGAHHVWRKETMFKAYATAILDARDTLLAGADGL